MLLLPLEIFAHNTPTRSWIQFRYDLYKNDPCFVPPLFSDQYRFFSPKNPSFQLSQVQCFEAKRGAKTVGRVLALINSHETKKLGFRRGRFGWFEAVDDQEVASGLLDSMRTWLVGQDCKEIMGPLGFTDLDDTGVLVDGFETVPTAYGSYNRPYYDKLFSECGFCKHVDRLEFRIKVNQTLPPVLSHILERSTRNQESLTARTPRSSAELRTLLPEIWELLEKSFAHLYGVVPLSNEQKTFYQEAFLSVLQPRFVFLVFDKHERLQGFLITLPSLSKALQRSGGYLWPWGWLRISQALRRFRGLDFVIGGTHPESCSGHVAAMLLAAAYEAAQKWGVEYIESNHELETNRGLTGLWSKFDSVQHRRTRIYQASS